MAELLPDKPKYENTLWRQLGWVKSVFASKFGAESSLLVSPEKVKVGCCELELELEELLLLRAEDPAPPDEARKSIHGTATCLPLPDRLDELAEPIPVLLLEELGLVLLLDEELGLVLLLLLGELVLADVPLLLNEITANSNLPEFGLMIKSLMVPISVPEEPITWAPVSWLPRKAS